MSCKVCYGLRSIRIEIYLAHPWMVGLVTDEISNIFCAHRRMSENSIWAVHQTHFRCDQTARFTIQSISLHRTVESIRRIPQRTRIVGSKLDLTLAETLKRIFPNENTQNSLMIFVFERKLLCLAPCPSGDRNRFLSQNSILALSLLFVRRSRFQNHFRENC